MHVSADREIRTVVGLRPFRASGFRVQAERLGDKLVVHNYGHGGSGVTMSWGTAGALVGAFRDQFLAATRFSYRWFQSLVGPSYGVRWMTNYSLSDEPFAHEDGLTGMRSPIRDLIPELADLPRGAHPFAVPYVRRFETMMIEPSIYLDAILRDGRLAGGTIVVRRFATTADLAILPESTIINCTGLGARALFGDNELTAIKGQLTVLLPQPEVDYAVLHGDLYMFSRRDGIVLGGTHERDVFTLEPDLVAKQRILAGHAQTFAPLAAG